MSATFERSNRAQQHFPQPYVLVHSVVAIEVKP